MLMVGRCRHGAGSHHRCQGQADGAAQQSAAITRKRELCVCFCNPLLFLIVILVVVKGAGLTSRGDGRASDSTEVYIYKGHRE